MARSWAGNGQPPSTAVSCDRPHVVIYNGSHEGRCAGLLRRCGAQKLRQLCFRRALISPGGFSDSGFGGFGGLGVEGLRGLGLEVQYLKSKHSLVKQLVPKKKHVLPSTCRGLNVSPAYIEYLGMYVYFGMCTYIYVKYPNICVYVYIYIYGRSEIRGPY